MPEEQPPTSTSLLDIPPKIDVTVLIIRGVATLLGSLGLSISTNLTTKQTTAQALLALSAVLWGLLSDSRGKWRRTRRTDDTERINNVN